MSFHMIYSALIRRFMRFFAPAAGIVVLVFIVYVGVQVGRAQFSSTENNISSSSETTNIISNETTTSSNTISSNSTTTTAPFTTALEVLLVSPEDNMVVSGVIDVSAQMRSGSAPLVTIDVIDLSGIESPVPLQTAVDGTGTRWTATLDTTTLSNGQKQILLNASDDAGGTASDSRIIDVQNQAAAALTVSLTSPAAGAVLSGAVSLEADAPEATTVQFSMSSISTTGTKKHNASNASPTSQNA